MKQKEHTKRALCMSILSMLLCCSMLIGSTFAWFTDSVTSGKNKIVAGNLDVELEYAAGFDSDGSVTAWEPVTETTDLFAAPDGEERLWEPGHTEVAYLRVRNAGTLALKYNLSAAVYGDELGAPEPAFTSVLEEEGVHKTFFLSDYLVFNVIEGASQITTRSDAWLDGGEEAEKAVMGDLSGVQAKEADLYPAGTAGKESEKVFTLAVYMPTWVGNEANYLTGTDRPEIYLGVQLDATQLPFESDSFDDQYDAGAELPKTESDAPVVLVPKTGWSIGSNLRTLIGDKIKEAGKTGTASNIQKVVFSNWDAYKDEVGGSYADGMIFGAVPEDELESSDETGARVFYIDDTKSIYFLTESKNAKIKAPISMEEMFWGYSSLTAVDLSGLDTSEVADFTRTFSSASALTEIDLSYLDVSSATTFESMFGNCSKLESVKMDGWDTSNLTSVASMFSYCKQLKSIDLSMLDLSHVTNFAGLFQKCPLLTEVNLGTSDFSAVTTISGMFSGCTSLASYNLTPFASAKLHSISSLFKDCTELTSMDLSMLDTSELTSIEDLFNGCTNLETINFGPSFTTEKVKNMKRAFMGCSSLVTLDISTFDPSAADPIVDGDGTESMFKNCTKLRTIYASEKFVIQNKAGYSRCTDMFKNCTSLVGGDGTKYDPKGYVNNQFQDYDRARIDGLGGKKGYFTNVAEKA